MATISFTAPSAAPIVSVTLTSLNDATTGASITLPSPATFTGPAAITGGNQWTINISAPSSTQVIWQGLATNTDGSTSQVGPGVVAGDAATANGYYCSLLNLQEEFGANNIATWSNLDNNPPVNTPPTANMARIQRALDYADQKINDYFGNLYVTPLSFGSATIPPIVVRWASTFAAAWLYTSRGKFELVPSGSPNGSKQVNRFSAMLEEQSWEMLNYLNGIRSLGAALKSGVSVSPSAVTGRFSRRGWC